MANRGKEEEEEEGRNSKEEEEPFLPLFPSLGGLVCVCTAFFPFPFPPLDPVNPPTHLSSPSRDHGGFTRLWRRWVHSAQGQVKRRRIPFPLALFNTLSPSFPPLLFHQRKNCGSGSAFLLLPPPPQPDKV